MTRTIMGLLPNSTPLTRFLSFRSKFTAFSSVLRSPASSLFSALGEMACRRSSLALFAAISILSSLFEIDGAQCETRNESDVAPPVPPKSAELHIDLEPSLAGQPRRPISPLLHGIFFEEIGHAGDGGLHAEMVQVRAGQGSSIAACQLGRRNKPPSFNARFRDVPPVCHLAVFARRPCRIGRLARWQQPPASMPPPSPACPSTCPCWLRPRPRAAPPPSRWVQRRGPWSPTARCTPGEREPHLTHWTLPGRPGQVH